MSNDVHLGFVKGFPLIKFQTAERIKQFQQGLLYMNSLETFRKIYRDSDNNVIGDPNEGKLIMHDAILAINGFPPQIVQDEALPTAGENDFVFCLYGLNPQKHSSLMFSEEFKREILKNYDTALLITDQPEFFRRVDKIASTARAFVQYYDPLVDDTNRLLSLLMGGIHRIAFYKTNNYSYQQEFRFVIPNPNTEEYHKLNIGDISDISRVFPAEQILNCVRIEKSSVNEKEGNNIL